MQSKAIADVINECETKKRVYQRGYAFVQILTKNGEWATINICPSYNSAQNYMNFEKRKHLRYQYRVA